MDLERTALPGIGFCHTFTTARGRRVGVISSHTGERDLLLYDPEDPDTVVDTVHLSIEESDGLADLLSASQLVERIVDVEKLTYDLITQKIRIGPRSAYDGKTLGDTQARTRTGASIVAVVRGQQVISSPRPDFVFAPEDVVVVVGTAEGTEAVAALLTNG